MAEISLHDHLKQIRSYFADGREPQDNELASIRRCLAADKVVTKEEAELLFELKDAYKSLENNALFDDIFTDGVTSYVLYTGSTPGALEDLEWLWLEGQISADRDYEPIERELLLTIVQRAETLPPQFHALVYDLEKRLGRGPGWLESFVGSLKSLLGGKGDDRGNDKAGTG